MLVVYPKVLKIIQIRKCPILIYGPYCTQHSMCVELFLCVLHENDNIVHLYSFHLKHPHKQCLPVYHLCPHRVQLYHLSQSQYLNCTFPLTLVHINSTVSWLTAPVLIKRPQAHPIRWFSHHNHMPLGFP